MSRILPAFLIAISLTGCASFSGLESSSSFSCKAPPGVSCQSISGTHANAEAGALPFQIAENKPKDASGADAKIQQYAPQSSIGKVSPRDMPASSSGQPVRQPPLVLRVWIAPYEDEGGDLYDQSYLYTMVHSGRWMIEANQKSITNQFKPVYPLNRNASKAVEESTVQPSNAVPVNQPNQNTGS